jgi:hypothetical protein
MAMAVSRHTFPAGEKSVLSEFTGLSFFKKGTGI